MDPWITPLITEHGFKRLKQRFGINKNRGMIVAKRAMNTGEVLKKFKKLRHLGKIVKYGDMIFIFIGRKMVTTYQYNEKPLNDIVAEMESNECSETSASQ